jgi:hypothetical protein
LAKDDKGEKLIPEDNPTADPDEQSRSSVRYGSVLDSLHILYPPTDLEKRNAVSRSDGYWPYINKGKDPPKQFTYGEFDVFFFAQLLDRALDHYDVKSWEDKVFTDIGSGTGRIVLAAAALHPWKLCRGVEVLEGIHNVALETLDKCRRTIDKVEINESTIDDDAEDACNDDFVDDDDDDDDKDDDTQWRPFGTVLGNDAWLNQLQHEFTDAEADEEVEGVVHESHEEPGELEEETAEQEHVNHFFLPVTGRSEASEDELELAPVQLVCGSFEDPYEYIGDSDLVFVFSSCMSENMMASLGKAIGRQCKPGALVITTDYMLPLEGVIAPLEDDEDMPFGPYKLDLVESVDGWCWLTGGQSTAHMHRVASSLWEDDVGPRQRPLIPLEIQAYRIIKAMEAGELTDSKKFLRELRNNMIFHEFPEKWLPSLDD